MKHEGWDSTGRKQVLLWLFYTLSNHNQKFSDKALSLLENFIIYQEKYTRRYFILFPFIEKRGWRRGICFPPFSYSIIKGWTGSTSLPYEHYFTLTAKQQPLPAFNWPTGIIIAVIYVILNPAMCHLKDGETGFSGRPCCHGNIVLRWLTLMDGDDLESSWREVEVCEPGVLQVMEVTLSECVPEGK